MRLPVKLHSIIVYSDGIVNIRVDCILPPERSAPNQAGRVVRLGAGILEEKRLRIDQTMNPLQESAHGEQSDRVIIEGYVRIVVGRASWIEVSVVAGIGGSF